MHDCTTKQWSNVWWSQWYKHERKIIETSTKVTTSFFSYIDGLGCCFVLIFTRIGHVCIKTWFARLLVFELKFFFWKIVYEFIKFNDNVNCSFNVWNDVKFNAEIVGYVFLSICDYFISITINSIEVLLFMVYSILGNYKIGLHHDKSIFSNRSSQFYILVWLEWPFCSFGIRCTAT